MLIAAASAICSGRAICRASVPLPYRWSPRYTVPLTAIDCLFSSTVPSRITRPPFQLLAVSPLIDSVPVPILTRPMFHSVGAVGSDAGDLADQVQARRAIDAEPDVAGVVAVGLEDDLLVGAGGPGVVAGHVADDALPTVERPAAVADAAGVVGPRLEALVGDVQVAAAAVQFQAGVVGWPRRPAWPRCRRRCCRGR